MKILFATPIFTGITSIILKNEKPMGMPAVYKLLEELVGKGHSVFVIGPWLEFNNELYSNIQFETNIIRDKITYRILKTVKKAIRPKKDNLLSRKLNRLVTFIYWYNEINKCFKIEKPDVVYSVFGLGMISNLIAKMNDKPSMLRVHGTFLGTDKLPGNLNRLSYKLKNITAWLSFNSPFEYLLMTNDGTKGDKAAKAFGVPEEKIKFWINGVKKDYKLITDEEKCRLRKALNISNDSKVILSVSRLEDWKRVDRIIRAVSRIKDVNGDFVVIIAGDGPEMVNLQNLSRQLAVDDKVRFLGFQSHEYVIKYMQLADIFVSAYDISNLCNPVLEAITVGKPIVSIDDGSLDTLIENGINGFLCHPQSVERELPEYISRLLRDDVVRGRMTDRLKGTTNGLLSTWEERIRREIDLIEQLHHDNSDERING